MDSDVGEYRWTDSFDGIRRPMAKRIERSYRGMRWTWRGPYIPFKVSLRLGSPLVGKSSREAEKSRKPIVTRGISKEGFLRLFATDRPTHAGKRAEQIPVERTTA